MKKKVIKLLKIVLIFVIILNIFAMNSTKTYAIPPSIGGPQESIVEDEESSGGSSGGLSGSGMTDISQNPGAWAPSSSTGSTSFDNKVSIIASIVRRIGIIISVITLMIIGIKFMLGSVEERAQYKQTLTPWLIGAILIFAMTNLPSVIYNFTQGTFN